jgi:hypothetical protein
MALLLRVKNGLEPTARQVDRPAWENRDGRRAAQWTASSRMKPMGD